MDRRSLIFFFALTLTFLGSKFAWEWYYSDQDKIWYEQQKTQENVVLTKLVQEMDQKNVKRSELPLYTVYDEAMDPLAEGFFINKVLITIATSNAMPERVFIEQNESAKEESKTVQEKRIPLIRLTDQITIGQPILYATDKNQRIPYYPLSEIGSYDLQILIAAPGELSTAVYAKQEEGHLTIPLQILAKKRPQDYSFQAYNGLVLIEKNKEFFPTGLYYAKENTLVPLDAYSDFLPYLQVSAEKTSPLSNSTQNYYVLENQLQQLVFSNQGGALVEINLPLRSEHDPLSPVYSIEYDREIAELTPRNNIFPFYPHYTLASPSTLVEGNVGGYYPLLRRDLAIKKGITHIHPTYYACNVISQYPEVAELIYEVKEYTENKIVFVAKQPHRTITKTYSLPADTKTSPYVVDLKIKVEGDSRGLYLTTGTPEVEWISGASAPNLRLCQTKNKRQEVESIDLPSDVQTIATLRPDWICNSNGFFGLILDAQGLNGEGYKTLKIPAEVLPSRLEVIQSTTTFTPDKLTGYAMMLPLNKPSEEISFRFIATPLSSPTLKVLDQTYSNAQEHYQPDYIEAISMQGWLSFITAPFSKVLLFIMRFFYYLTESWALAIIFLTITLRIVLYPLNAWSMKSMSKTQEIAPLIQKIQEKHKNDKHRIQMEIANLYREKGVNPLSGCLPMLIQIPFLFSMFDVLKTTFELRGAPFIPGWIDNLAAPDVLFSWGYPIPFIGSNFHLLPILLGAVMFLQTQLSTKTSDTSQMTDAQRQQRAMGTIMPVIFTFFFYHFPSGLNLYWLFSTLFGILQQWAFNKYGKKIKK